MRVLLLRPLALIVVAAAGVGACTDAKTPTAPAERALVGTFVLQSLDGAPVPALEFDYGTARQYVSADTLTADGQGGYARVTMTRTDSVGRAFSATQRDAYAGAYAVRGDTVYFPVTCRPGAQCLNMPVGWRTADGSLVLAFRALHGFALVSHFARVR